MIPRDDVVSIIEHWLMYARVAVRKTVSLSEVAMPHEGPARPAAVTPQLLSNVHQVTNVLQNPENPSVSATSSGSTATVSSSVTSVQNSEPAHVVLSSSTTTVPSTSTTSVTPSPTPSLSENSQSNFEVRRFIYWVFCILLLYQSFQSLSSMGVIYVSVLSQEISCYQVFYF